MGSRYYVKPRTCSNAEKRSLLPLNFLIKEEQIRSLSQVAGRVRKEKQGEDLQQLSSALYPIRKLKGKEVCPTFRLFLHR